VPGIFQSGSETATRAFSSAFATGSALAGTLWKCFSFVAGVSSGPIPELTLISSSPSFLSFFGASSLFLFCLTKFFVPLKKVRGDNWRIKAVVMKIKMI
jgi:hypothetical protein